MIITSTKAPTTSTPGAVGDIILNPETGDVYKCTAIGKNMSDYGFVDVYSHAVDQYVWEKIGVKYTVFYVGDDRASNPHLYLDPELSRKASIDDLQRAMYADAKDEYGNSPYNAVEIKSIYSSYGDPVAYYSYADDGTYISASIYVWNGVEHVELTYHTDGYVVSPQV